MSEHENCHVEPVEKPIDYVALESAQAAFLSVSGMGCPRCAARVRNGLLLLDGVLYAKISLETSSAAVAYDPDRIHETDLVTAVAHSGDDGRHQYRAQVLRKLPAQEAFFLAAPGY